MVCTEVVPAFKISERNEYHTGRTSVNRFQYRMQYSTSAMLQKNNRIESKKSLI